MADPRGPHAPWAEASSAAYDVPAAPLRVLVVDDDEDDYVLVRELLAELPETGGVATTWAPSFGAGLARAGAPWDVVLVDYRLGAEDGVAFVRAARAAGLDAPQLLLTGQGCRDVALEALAAGAADYVLKEHLTVDGLERAIRYAIERARTAAALQAGDRARRASEESARAAEARFRTALDGMLDAFYIVRPVHGADGAVADFAIVDANVPGAALLGATPGDLVGQPVTALLPALRESPLFAIGCEVLATGQRYEGEYQRRDPRTTAEWSRLQVVRTPEGLAVTARDITEAKRAAQALADLAVHDELTGLLNRRGFRQLATHEIRVGRRERRHDALLCLDLNGFKAVNDTWGHAAGDQVLQVVGRVLRETLRESDVSARLGGDEFAVYAPALHDGHDGHVVAARIWAALAADNAAAMAAGRPYAIHVGIGVSQVMPGDDLDALLARADAALYANKASHRGACRP